MLIVISPAKKMDMSPMTQSLSLSYPEMLVEANSVATELKKLSIGDIVGLMKISSSLAELNFGRFQSWRVPYDKEEAKPAVYAFNGDVYRGLDVHSLAPDKVELLQQRLRILSGLYGVLRPLDLILAYRLEMGTKLQVGEYRDLYAFWKEKITSKLNETLKESETSVLINLASNEYFKSINIKELRAEVINPEFKDMKNGSYKMISFYAKKARGLMTRFIVENEISSPRDLSAFDLDGYAFNPRLSKPGKPVFTRG